MLLGAIIAPSGPDLSSGAQVTDGLVSLEQIEKDAQRFPALGDEFGIALHDQPRIVACRRQQLSMRGEIGQPESGQAALPCAEQLARAAQRRSSSAMTKPSFVSRRVVRRAFAVSPSGGW